MKQWVKSGSAAGNAFCAAFFFLTIAKPLFFVSLAAAFILFFASELGAKSLRGWRTMPWVKPAVVLALVPLLSILVHEDLQAAADNLNLSYYWLFAFGTTLAASQMSIIPWLRAFVAGVFVIFCIAQLQLLGWVPPEPGPSGLRIYILYSQFLAIGIALLSVLYRYEERRRTRIVYLAGMGLFFLGMLSTKGRSGMLALVVLLPLVFANIFQQANRAKVLVACLIAALALLMSPQVRTRISDTVSDLRLMQQNMNNTSLGYRVEMWHTAWDLFVDHPVIGSGPTGFGKAWSSVPRGDEAKDFIEPHNAFFFFATAYGVVGLVALVWLCGALLQTGWVWRHTMEGNIALAFALVFVLGSFTNTMFKGTVSHAWIMLFIGLQGRIMRSLLSGTAATGSR